MPARYRSWVLVLPLAWTLAAPEQVHSAAGGLTGDWDGARTSLVERGTTVRLDWTNFYQGLVSGTGERDWEYGGRLDGYLDFDTGKLGLWEGGVIKMHGEYYYGNLGYNLGGTIVPNNVGMRLPNGSPESFALTNLTLTQQLGKGGMLILGAINTVDLLAGHAFFGGAGVTRFFNLAFAAPPNGLQPAVIVGGAWILPREATTWTFMVFDPSDRTRGGWFDDLFGSGVNISASGKRSFKLAGRASALTLTGIYSTADSVNLGDVLLPPELHTGVEDDSWHASVQFDHMLREDEDKSGRSWGIHVKAGASDGNPNPYQAFITGGIGGKGLIAGRSQDTFGIGYFYYNLSDDLQDVFNPAFDFDDEQGLEIFYDWAVQPWLHVAADLQYIDPATGSNDRAFIAGLRLRVAF